MLGFKLDFYWHTSDVGNLIRAKIRREASGQGQGFDLLAA